MNEVTIYGEIGWDNTTQTVTDQLAQVEPGAALTVRINSPGGDVYEGLGIMNALRAHQGEVTAVIEGLAASAASFIAVGGADRIVARPHAELMIHDAWAWVDGNAEKLQKKLTDLERVSQNLANIYADRAGGDPEHWRALMREETWFSAQEALDAGLVDAVEDARQPANAGVKQPVFAKALERFKFGGRAAAPAPKINAQHGQEGDSMNVLNQLAQELGKTPEDVRDALSGFFNEAVEITAPVTVEFPDEVEVVPTGKVIVSPTVGEIPAGVVPEATIGDGFTVEVSEAGEVTVRATDAVALDDTGELVLTFPDGATATVTVKVVAADAGEEESTPTGDPAAAPSGDPAPGTAEFAEVPQGFVLVPQAHLDELSARARAGEEAHETKARAERAATVEADIAAGRFSAGRRDEALAVLEKNPGLYSATWGALPKGTIPRTEMGHGVDVVQDDDGEKSPLSLIAKANARKAKN